MNDNLNYEDIFARLAAPFHPDDIEWRAGATNADKTKALALAYITSRGVMNRLDEVIGPQNWRDEYRPGPDGGVVCGLSLRIYDEWVTKWDGAENTDFEAIKGGLSDAFKRAGVKWGIGRYLYRLENVWVPCEMHGKTVALKSTPPLPSWALPNEWISSSGAVVGKPAALPEREQELLGELGFKPVPEPVAVAIGGNGSNGGSPKAKPETPASNGKRNRSWGMNQVEVMLKNKLATNPSDAVRMLNESGLDAHATPEQILAHFQK